MSNTFFSLYVKDTVRFRTLASTIKLVVDINKAMWENNTTEMTRLQGFIQTQWLEELHKPPYSELLKEELRFLNNNSILYGLNFKTYPNPVELDLVNYAYLDTGYGHILANLEDGSELPLTRFNSSKKVLASVNLSTTKTPRLYDAIDYTIQGKK